MEQQYNRFKDLVINALDAEREALESDVEEVCQASNLDFDFFDAE